MKRKISIGLVLVLLFCLISAVSAGEKDYSFNKYPVDVDAMKALEKQDTFGVRVVKKVVTDRVNTSLRAANPDMLSLTIQNDSSVTVSECVILAVAYDENMMSAELQPEAQISLSLNGTAKRKISTFMMNSLKIAPGATLIKNIACNHSRFTGVRVIVAQYTDSEGQIYTNELYPEWQELALGSPTIILE